MRSGVLEFTYMSKSCKSKGKQYYMFSDNFVILQFHTQNVILLAYVTKTAMSYRGW